MEHQDAKRLIEKGIDGANVQRWADLGCGNGTFTLALAELLAPGSEIFAYDLKQQDLTRLLNRVNIHFERLDFNKVNLSPTNLHGILMANSLHYIKEKADLINRLNVSKFVIVEYERNSANPWVPYPITSRQLALLFSKSGYQTEKLMSIPSSFGGSIYSLLATRLH